MEYQETSLDIKSWIQSLKDKNERLDLVITDPPYPFDNRNGTGRHAYVDNEDNMYTRMTWEQLENVFDEMLDLMNDGGRLYVFCNRDGYEETKNILITLGWRYLNTIVWNKKRFGGGYHWRQSTEFIHYFCKPPKPALLVQGASNVFEYSKPTKNSAIPEIGYDPISNASPKPNEIWRDIMIHGAKEGDIVADPFAGSNPLKVALFLNPELKEKISKAYSNCVEV